MFCFCFFIFDCFYLLNLYVNCPTSQWVQWVQQISVHYCATLMEDLWSLAFYISSISSTNTLFSLFLEGQYPCKKNKNKKNLMFHLKEKKRGKKSWFSICDLSCAFTKHQRMTNLVKLTWNWIRFGQIYWQKVIQLENSEGVFNI